MTGVMVSPAKRTKKKSGENGPTYSGVTYDWRDGQPCKENQEEKWRERANIEWSDVRLA